MKLWSNRYSINNFPKHLPSLDLPNPSESEIKNDFKKLTNFYSHAAWKSFALNNKAYAHEILNEKK
jgi:hypothetical protein